MQAAERNFMPIKARTGSIVHFFVTVGGLMMKSKTIQNISAYMVSVSIFRKFMVDGLISEDQFRKCESKIAKQYGISLCSIYRDIPLTLPPHKS